MSDNSEDIADTFEKMLLSIGKQVAEKYKVNASQVAPDEHGNISNTIKPIMKMAKGLFKTLLGQNFNSTDKLSSLNTMFNQSFLDGINKSASKGPNKSPIALAIQLLTNIGIPLLKTVIGHAVNHQKSEEHKAHPAAQGVNANQKNTFQPAKGKRTRAFSTNDLPAHLTHAQPKPSFHSRRAPK